MKKNVLVLSSMIFMGCATQTKSTNKKSIKYTQFVEAVAIKEHKPKIAYRCPKSKKNFENKDWKMLTEMANDCIGKDKWGQVLQLAEHMTQQDPHSPWGAYYYSLEAENNNQLERSMWMIDLALKKAPNAALLHYQKGRVLWKNFQFEIAMEELRKAVKLNPKLDGANSLLGQIYLREQEYKKAIKHFDLVVHNKKYKSIALSGLAESYFYLEKYEESLKFLNRSVVIKPHSLRSRMRQAFIYERVQKNNKQALAIYKKISYYNKKNKLDMKPGIDLSSKIKELETAIKKEEAGRQLSSTKDKNTKG